MTSGCAFIWAADAAQTAAAKTDRPHLKEGEKVLRKSPIWSEYSLTPATGPAGLLLF